MKIKMKTLGFIGVICLSLGACAPDAALEMPVIFSDNMVLQHSSSVAFWGMGEPGSKIVIETGWDTTAKTEVQADSTWIVKVPTVEPGGPYLVTIKNGNQVKNINNVLLGEVWLGSGQSNMEMPLGGWPPFGPIMNSDQAVATSDFPMIRMFTVTRNSSAQPLDDLKGSWNVSTPENSPLFSATAFFFARKLHRELGIPVGIIHSSWGGTPAESWISGKTLASDADFVKVVEDLKLVWPQIKAYDNWLNQHEVINAVPDSNGVDPLIGMDLFDDFCTNPDMNTDSWEEINLPSLIESSDIGDIDGAVWFRKEVEIPQEWDGKELTLNLGPIDDRDVTWFNGQRIGGMEGSGFYQAIRSYTVPADLVKSGKAVIAVRMIDTQQGGGIYGKPDQMTLSDGSQSISLAGSWKYRVVAQYREGKLYLLNPETNEFATRPELAVVPGAFTPTALYNAMIAPLTPYTIKGAIWYQGEANVGRSAQYVRLMSMLIDDWRKQFDNSEMPFYYVQLAPWHNNNVEGSSSAKIRDAQRRTLSIAHTGMAVTLDIGDVNNIHPANKTDVGERLALWALANDYRKQIPYSGPLYESFSVEGNKLTVAFTHVDEGLVLNNQVAEQFELAGEDGVFYPAKAVVEGSQVVLTSPRVAKPVNARYAYKNGSEASLFNGAGLPASSFTTEAELVD